MKITIAWNVWNNYEDVLLGSEILKKKNDEIKVFEQLKIISQGGYAEPPSQRQAKYLDKHLKIEVDMSNPIILESSRNIGSLRIIGGIKAAFNYAASTDSDFLVITNADAWFLDPDKLKALLLSDGVAGHCIAARVGKTTAIINEFGDYVPFFDDHFIVINVKRCKSIKIFDYEFLKCVNPIFRKYGGFHYMLGCYFEEVLPAGELYIYTDMNGASNHYGENIAHNLLPWQFQAEFGFLHANCMEHPKLHFLRAALARMYKFDDYPSISKYCKEYSSEVGIKRLSNKIFFNMSIYSRIKFYLLTLQVDFRQFILYMIIGRKYMKLKIKHGLSGIQSSRICFEQRGVDPVGIGSRE